VKKVGTGYHGRNRMVAFLTSKTRWTTLPKN